ncbi:hypothetical protein MMC07_001406 [Pseudocyphellaria aurata]|nr:hypothetical protein [Pseudocyphellaria aurata]
MPPRNGTLFSNVLYSASPSNSVLPFLYQTRTLQSQLPSRDEKGVSYCYRAHRSFRATLGDATSNEIPFEENIPSSTAKQNSRLGDSDRKEFRRSDFRRLNLKGFTRPPVESHVQFPPSHTAASVATIPHSTLTASEKAAFDRIFKNIDHSKKEETSLEDFGDEFGGNDIEDIDTVFENAIERQSSLVENRDAASPTAPHSSEVTHPDPLQYSQEKAFTIKIKSARTDIEVWTLLETEVFWLFGELKKREKDTKSRDENPPVKKRKAPKREQKKGTDSTETVLLESESILSILQNNYGDYCLSALRLLRREFPSSPYVLHLLPTIKRFGPISYVLGASTALYNEILFVKWTQYSDLDGMADLVKEMLDKGVEVNEVSIKLLVAVAKERQKALSADGDLNQAKKAWWRLSGVQESWHRMRLLLDASIQDLRRRRASEERERLNDDDKENLESPAAEMKLRPGSVERERRDESHEPSAESSSTKGASRTFHLGGKPNGLVRYHEV